MAEIENLKIGANGTIHIVGNENIITEEWEASKTYVKDKSYVIREHKLYVCNVTHTSTSSFDPTKWTEITVIGAIDNALDVTAEASGAIATFDTSLALPLQDCTIAINAVQESGTPTPSSPKAISGFTGANITQAPVYERVIATTPSTQTSDGITVTTKANGLIEVNGTASANGTITFNCNPFVIPSIDGRTMRLNNSFSGGFTVRFFNDSTEIDYWALNAINRTVTNYSGMGGQTVNKIAIAYSSGASVTNGTLLVDFIANSTTTAITWQSEAGTVYGGSLDVTSGKLTVTYGYKDLGSITYQRYQASGVYYFRSYDITDIKPATAPNPANILCECYDIKTSSTLDEDCIAVANGQKIIYIRDDTYTSENALQTALSGMLLVYELDTPVTYQLTPTQISAIVGTNNVFTDTNGDTSLEYYTKRGEQTVRIAEGVAVDVINNKSIDTLATTDKTVKGAINELAADKFDSANRVSTGSGTFAGLLNAGDCVWLIIAQRLSTNSTIVLVAHKQGSSYYFKEIVKDSGMAYNYNQDNGSVVITYGGQTTGVYGGAYRLV